MTTPIHARALAALVALLVLATPPVRAQRLEFKMISSGANRPGLRLGSRPYLQILAGLHAGHDAARLAADLGLASAEIAARLDSLLGDGLVTRRGNALHPTCMVVTAEEGAALAASAAAVARGAVPFMRQAVERLRGEYRSVPGLARLAFDDVSFFLASDVLLDNWQINAVEARWLKAERPLRGRGRYYCAIFTRTDEAREAYGIYGNQMSGLGEGRTFAVYGNRRGGEHDLTSLRADRLAALTGLPDTTARAALQARLFEDLGRWAAGAPGYTAPGALSRGLEGMGLVRDGRPLFALLDTADDRRLDDLAAGVTDSLVAHLARSTPRLRAEWKESAWGAEVTFEEYGIWWYHFFYTALTDQLGAEGVIHIPATGLFHYGVVR